MSTKKDENNEEVQLLTGNGDVFSGVTVDQKLLAKSSALYE
jgi:hypothetical protein